VNRRSLNARLSKLERGKQKVARPNAGNTKFERFREMAIAALLAHATIKTAAMSIGIGECTLRGWLQDDGFAAEYAQARARMLETAEEKLKSSMLRAAQILLSIAESRAKPTARISAARSLLEYAFRSIECEELREIHRIVAQLEEKLEGKNAR
jgi:hypothetical protein